MIVFSFITFIFYVFFNFDRKVKKETVWNIFGSMMTFTWKK